MANLEPLTASQGVSRDELPQSSHLERLGRQRPAIFSSTWMEIAFVVFMIGSLAMSDFVIGGFKVVLPALTYPFDIPPESQTWPSSVLTLVAGAFLFPFGRLADMYGGYCVFNGGLIWFIIWTVTAGFAPNFTTLVVCRAMEGLGTAAFLPAGISLLGRIYRPGPRKNLVFSLYGALAPVGFSAGIIIGGLAQDFLSWRWYFWLGSIIAGLCCLGCLLTSPRDYAEARKSNVKMDWWGACTLVPDLMLLVYAVTESANVHAGWTSPKFIVTLILGVLCLVAAVYVEGWVATAPLIPADIFRVQYMKRIFFICCFRGVSFLYTYSTQTSSEPLSRRHSFGRTWILIYASIEQILGKPALITAIWFAPWAAGGVVLSITSGLILHLIPGRVLLIIAGFSKVLAVLFFALMPDDPIYWAWVFPAMVFEAACVDVLWTVSNVFLTTSLPGHRQGLAGALISVTLFLGGAFLLAVADVAKCHFEAARMDLKAQFKGVLWIGVGVAAVALVTCVFIRLDKASCSLTVEEKQDAGPDSGLKAISRASTPESDMTAVETESETLLGS